MNPIFSSIIVWLGKKIVQLVGKTSSGQTLTNPLVRDLKQRKKNVIYVFWHGRQFFLLWAYRHKNISLLISQSKDGELIARVGEQLGYQTIRGSSSRGGKKALVQLIRKARQGFDLAITPDGPRGPAGNVEFGVLFVASKTGLPIIPLAFGAKRKFIFKSWDKFCLPLPWSKVTVVEGAPFYVAPGDNLAEKARELAELINKTTEEADRLTTA